MVVLLPVLLMVVFLQLSYTACGFLGKTKILARKAPTSSVLRQRLRLSSLSHRATCLFASECEVKTVLEKKQKGPCVEPATKIYSNVADVLTPNGEKVPSNGSEVRVGIIIARGNGDATSSIHKDVNESLRESGVSTLNKFITFVPSIFELPVTAKLLASSKRVDVIIALGCLTQDENTFHFESTAAVVANGLMQVSLDTMIPCIHGVLTAPSLSQAVALSTGAANPGKAWGKAAVEMGLHRMAAMGVDGKVFRSDINVVPLVTFQGLAVTALGNEDEALETKKFGF